MISVFSVGSYFLHLVFLKSYKKEFKSYIFEHKKETAFTTISINPSELYINSTSVTWEDENKEIIYKGMLYDIVSVSKTESKIIVTVVSDTQEMELKKQFASIYDINSNTSTKHPFELLKNFFALKYIVNNTLIEFNNSVLNCVSPNSYLLSQIPTIVIHQETPPPEFCIN